MLSRRQFAALLLASPAVFGAGHTAFAAEAYDAARFEQLTQQGTVIVHVRAGWCPVCRLQEPVLDKLAAEPAFKDIRFVKVDFDTDRDFLRRYKVANQSTVLVYKKGAETGRILGLTDIEQLRKELQKAL